MTHRETQNICKIKIDGKIVEEDIALHHGMEKCTRQDRSECSSVKLSSMHFAGKTSPWWYPNSDTRGHREKYNFWPTCNRGRSYSISLYVFGFLYKYCKPLMRIDTSQLHQPTLLEWFIKLRLHTVGHNTTLLSPYIRSIHAQVYKTTMLPTLRAPA